MPTVITPISIEEMETIFYNSNQRLNWQCPFVIPLWLKCWWSAFGAGKKQMILKIESDAALIGIAPLMLEDDRAQFLGSESLCDYQDMIIDSKRSDAFFSALLDYLKKMNVSRLELGALHPDSMVLSGLSKAGEEMNYHPVCELTDRFYELELPDTWEGYLDHLNGKQRHEVRRKIRRLNEIGRVDYNVFDNTGPFNDAFEEFLSLFQASRQDKAQFLTDPARDFFKSLAEDMAEKKMLSLGFLSVDGNAVASTFCFEYLNTMYLYNNGYHPGFRSFSPGSLCKVFSIRHSIEKKMAFYDFLKGDEAYKERLGGRAVPLYRIRIELT